MKRGWEVKKLGEVCEVKGGKRLPKGCHLINIPTNHPYIRVADFKDNGSVNIDSVLYISDGVYDKIRQYTISSNDLYISIAGTIGKSGIIPKSLDGANLTENACKLVFKKNVFNRYIYYGTLSTEFKQQIKSLTKTTTQPKLALSRLTLVELPIPSLSEQERIVRILDSAFAKIETLRANAKRNLNDTKELFQVSLKQELSPKQGWEIKKLDEVSEVTSSKRVYKDEYVAGGVPFYRTKEIKELSNNKEISVELFISRQRYSEIKEKYGVPQVGDILISAVGTIGEILVVQDDSEFYFKDGNIIWIKSLKKLTSSFLSYNLKSIIERLKSITIGAAYSALTIEKLKEMKISFPDSLVEQQAIVEKLDSLNERCQAMEENYRQTVLACDDLKQALLRKAFNGEL